MNTNNNAFGETILAFIIGFFLVYAFKPPTHDERGRKIKYDK